MILIQLQPLLKNRHTVRYPVSFGNCDGILLGFHHAAEAAEYSAGHRHYAQYRWLGTSLGKKAMSLRQ